jgi:tRNA-specific 2-thiouridylase
LQALPLHHGTASRVHDASCLQLPTAHKRDSQGICFIGKRDFPSFISSYIPSAKGHFVDEHGCIVASHSGHFQYTIGQAACIGGQSERLHVAAKDAATNRVLVVPVRSQALHLLTPSHPIEQRRTHRLLYAKRALAHDMHWIAQVPPPLLRDGAAARFMYPSTSHHCSSALMMFL